MIEKTRNDPYPNVEVSLRCTSGVAIFSCTSLSLLSTAIFVVALCGVVMGACALCCFFFSHLLPCIRMYLCRVLADILFCVHDVCVCVW